MIARLGTLAVGILIGYSLAYFHVNVAPEDFVKGNEDRLLVQRPKIEELAPLPELPPATISLEDELKKFALSHEWDRVISLGSAGIAERPEIREAVAPIMDKAYAHHSRKAYEKAQYESTIKLLNASQQFVALDGEENLMLAHSLLELKQYDAAYKAIKEAEKLSANSEAVRKIQRKIVSQLLNQHIARKQISESIQLLEQELLSDAGHSPYYLRLAELQYQNGDINKSIVSFESATNLGEQLNARQSKMYKKSKRRLTSPNVIEIPMKTQGNNLFVDAILNHSSPPMHFLVDTGASLTTISPQVANALGVFHGDDTSVVSVSTANGTVSAPKITLENVAVADAQVDDVETVVLANMGEGIDGLLGLSFLQHFDVEISNEENLLILRPR
ncbi:MAG: retroviral-like aspartic protease family protein [Gammaproteobacteria bacterium]|nr:retroviral-like aspartic protease family protein [Gammaproteobacteria bacterium]